MKALTKSELETFEKEQLIEIIFMLIEQQMVLQIGTAGLRDKPRSHFQ